MDARRFRRLVVTQCGARLSRLVHLALLDTPLAARSITAATLAGFETEKSADEVLESAEEQLVQVRVYHGAAWDSSPMDGNPTEFRSTMVRAKALGRAFGWVSNLRILRDVDEIVRRREFGSTRLASRWRERSAFGVD